MRRLYLLIGALGLVLAACASDGAEPTTTGGGLVSTTQAVSTTEAAGATSSTGSTATTDVPADTTTTPVPEGTTSGRPVAPDFTLTLGDGGSYTLSEGAKPVYLIFWAEW